MCIGKIISIEYGYDATNSLDTHISNSSSGNVTRFNFNQTENKFIVEYSRVHLQNFLHDYIFNELGRKTQIAIQYGTNIYTTNRVGRCTQMVDQDGSEVNYSYNAAERLTGLTNKTNSSIH